MIKQKGRNKYDAVELVKKRENTNASDNLRNKNNGLVRSTRMKILPQVNSRDMEKVMEEWKATLPMLQPSELRRFQMSLHEAILLELKDDGYEESARWFTELLSLDNKIREEADPGSLLWKKPFLKEQKNFLDCLKNGLIMFEDAKTVGNFAGQLTALLDVAIFFHTKTWEWCWIADFFYQRALAIAEITMEDDPQSTALIRYLYGRFLFNQMRNPEEALDYLNMARESSKRKSWNASRRLGEKQFSIFKECNILLYKILLILARKIICDDPDLALKACIQAVERATDTENDEYMVEALLELGICYLQCGNTKEALKKFSRLLIIAKRISDIDNICKAHMQLAFVYKQLEDDYHTEKHLRLFRENAEHFGLTEKLAHAHYYTGEHYLSRGKPHLSTSHLETAFNIYNTLDFTDEANRARIIAGVSKGQERIDRYIHLILLCGRYDRKATLKICKWKNLRECFWFEDKHGNSNKNIEIHYYVSLF